LRLKDSDEAIGYVQATVDEGGNSSIAYVVGSRWQHQGLAVEAVEAMIESLQSAGIQSVAAAIVPSHKASAGVAMTVGLRKTGEKTRDGSEEIWALPK